MITNILLGAWILVLTILGAIVISTGLPEKDDINIIVLTAKGVYLIALCATFYKIGGHLTGM